MLRYEDEATLAQVLAPNQTSLSPTWTRSFVVDPEKPSWTKACSHGHLWFQWITIICKWKAVMSESIQWVQILTSWKWNLILDLTTKKANWLSLLKSNPTAAVCPSQCSTTQLPKMTHFCSVTTEKSLTGFPLLMVPTANKLKQTLDVSCGNHLNSALWHPKNPAVIPMLGSMGGEVHQASWCYYVPQRSS